MVEDRQGEQWEVQEIPSFSYTNKERGILFITSLCGEHV